jgi:hypothetical protein
MTSLAMASSLARVGSGVTVAVGSGGDEGDGAVVGPALAGGSVGPGGDGLAGVLGADVADGSVAVGSEVAGDVVDVADGSGVGRARRIRR